MSADRTTDQDRAVFWYGCNMTRHGELIRNSARLLEAVGVAAEPAGGPAYCCGSAKESSAQIAGGMGERTVEAFNATGTPQVITWCPSCHMNTQDIMAPVTAPEFTTQHLSEVLHARRGRLAPMLRQRIGLRVLVHKHQGFNARVPVNDIVPELLRMIPGLEVLEHDLRIPGHMCSALVGVPGAILATQSDQLAAITESGADAVVTIFHSCHREMASLERGRTLKVFNWVHLLAQAIGWDAADDYKTWRNASDPRAEIGQARIEAAGEVAFERLTEPELRRPATI